MPSTTLTPLPHTGGLVCRDCRPSLLSPEEGEKLLCWLEFMESTAGSVKDAEPYRKVRYAIMGGEGLFASMDDLWEMSN